MSARAFITGSHDGFNELYTAKLLIPFVNVELPCHIQVWGGIFCQVMIVKKKHIRLAFFVSHLLPLVVLSPHLSISLRGTFCDIALSDSCDSVNSEVHKFLLQECFSSAIIHLRNETSNLPAAKDYEKGELDKPKTMPAIFSSGIVRDDGGLEETGECGRGRRYAGGVQ